MTNPRRAGLIHSLSHQRSIFLRDGVQTLILPLGRIVNELEETAIALILALMTLITFINVVLRMVLNTGIILGIGGSDVSCSLAGLFGRHGGKVTAIWGSTAVVTCFRCKRRIWRLVRRRLICVVYAALLMKGVDY